MTSQFWLSRNFLVTPLLASFLLVACKTTPPTTLPRGHSATFEKSGRFRIGESDILEVLSSVPKEPVNVTTVNIDGFIHLPLVGAIKAAGLTTLELEKQIEEKYLPLVKNAKFTVNIREMRSYKVYVYGETKVNGEYQFNARISLLSALAKAGGLTDFANGRLTLFRRDQNGQVRYDFTMDDVFREEGSGEPLYLERSDVLVAY